MSVFSVRRAVAVVGAVVLSGAVFAVPAAAAEPAPCAALVAAQGARDDAFVVDANADSDLAKAQADGAAAITALTTANANLTAAQSKLATDNATLAVAVKTANAADVANQQARAAATADGVVNESDPDVVSTQAEADRTAGIVNDLNRTVADDEAAITAAENDVDAVSPAGRAAQNTIASAQIAATNAQDVLDRAQAALAGVRCPDGDNASNNPGDVPDVVAARIAAQIDTLSCDDYRDELAAIRGALLDTDTQTLLGSQRVGELLERLRLRNAAIGGCTATAAPAVGDDRDCADFASPADAQRFFLAVRTVANPDPSRLDSNGNGIACESSEVVVSLDPLADDGSVANATQIRIVPQGSVSTGGA